MRLALLLGVLPLVGCFYPADRGRALEARVDRLSSKNEVLEKELRERSSQLDQRVAEKIAQVEVALESLDKASRRSDADTGVLLQKTAEDLAALRGLVESYQHKLGELEAQLAQAVADNERRFTELKGTEAVKAAEAKKKADELKRPEDKKEFFALAATRHKDGELLVARQLYAEFLKKWGKDELAGDARFGLGETYLAEDKCREALFEYGKVIQEHVKSPSAPNAYLRSSECFTKLKLSDESRLALEEVVKQYPKSEAAKTAKVRLAELDKAKQKAPAPRKKK